MEKTSGFDMGNTIEWYRNSGVRISEIFLGKTLPFPVEDEHLIELSRNEMAGLYNLFPENARQRNIARKVIGRPTRYFHRNSTNESPLPTFDVEEAISPTAIIPSYIGYAKQEGELVGDIEMYELPEDIPENARKIISAEGFVHELGHGIVQPALFVNNYNLQFPDGKIVNGINAMFDFANMAEQHKPISHYAKTYRPNFSSSDTMKLKTAISEEAAETLVAYFLGFAYCGDDKRGKDPFADRPEIKEFIKNFLDAKLVGWQK